ncbi:hypothetical protein K457DRAFT_14783 [Linnemannia elongata AG-77]|uniref:MFS general substrate transporter n=1 Tax=Linnemannia elongata AG-77 TaxID=1314771 RepID=A0A197K8R3_9FUNG|nr:hypothetical protein K457DRAFT_14783 [Linnemannia elongata AG-77]
MEGCRTDFVDMVSFTPGIVAIIYYLSEGPAAGWKAASTLAPLVVGIALLIGFVVYENKIYYPIILFISGSPGDWSNSASTTSSHPPLYGFEERTDYIVHGVGITALISHMVQQIQAYRTKITIIGWLFLTAAGVVCGRPNFLLGHLFPSPGFEPVWHDPNCLCCQVKSIADANDEDQGVVGTMYNVGLRLGAPVAVALSNIIANSHNSPTTIGAELLPGYHAAFYTEAVLGGIGLLIAILYAATQRPCRGGWKARVRAPRGYRSRGCRSCC